jgi:GntR family transcriptional regulator/MocR family aminotransferase
MDIHLDVEGTPGHSRRARLENALREAVASGRLVAGARVPATRVLAEQLGVSRGVVAEAYAQLTAEGYLRGRRGAGTRVVAQAGPRPEAHAGRRSQPGVRYDLSPFRPALDGFPRTEWRVALAAVLREAREERLGQPDPAGTPELREALAGYLGRARGVRADPGQVMVVSGLRAGLHLLWPALTADGARTVAVEDPGWRGVRETALAAGLLLRRVPVDGEGIDASALWSEAVEAVEAVAVTPAHQFPTGAVLSAPRRSQLIAWTRERAALGRAGTVIEDDYDGEYRYDRRPVGALQGLAPEAVVYGGSASKTIAPALRLGWLVLPRWLVGWVTEEQRLRGTVPSPLQQLALARMIETGGLDRHLRRARRRYARRREAILDALAAELPEAEVAGAAAGLFVTVRLQEGANLDLVLEAAARRRIAVEGFEAWRPLLAVGYANLPEAAARVAVRALAASVREAAAPLRG